MQNNSQGRRDPKAAPAHESSSTQPDSRGLRTETHPVDEAAPAKMVAEVMKDFTEGIVTDCVKLNVREAPSTDAKVLDTIELLTWVEVDTAASTSEFYKVRTEDGVEGFCMRKYIALKR